MITLEKKENLLIFKTSRKDRFLFSAALFVTSIIIYLGLINGPTENFNIIMSVIFLILSLGFLLFSKEIELICDKFNNKVIIKTKRIIKSDEDVFNFNDIKKLLVISKFKNEYEGERRTSPNIHFNVILVTKDKEISLKKFKKSAGTISNMVSSVKGEDMYSPPKDIKDKLIETANFLKIRYEEQKNKSFLDSIKN